MSLCAVSKPLPGSFFLSLQGERSCEFLHRSCASFSPPRAWKRSKRSFGKRTTSITVRAAKRSPRSRPRHRIRRRRQPQPGFEWSFHLQGPPRDRRGQTQRRLLDPNRVANAKARSGKRAADKIVICRGRNVRIGLRVDIQSPGEGHPAHCHRDRASAVPHGCEPHRTRGRKRRPWTVRIHFRRRPACLRVVLASVSGGMVR